MITYLIGSRARRCDYDKGYDHQVASTGYDRTPDSACSADWYSSSAELHRHVLYYMFTVTTKMNGLGEMDWWSRVESRAGSTYTIC